MANNSKKDRYQFQPWYIKLWRRRWYVVILYWAFMMWFRNFKRFPLSFCFKLATGIAQSRMNWTYDWKDVKKHLEKKIQTHKKKNV